MINILVKHSLKAIKDVMLVLDHLYPFIEKFMSL